MFSKLRKESTAVGSQLGIGHQQTANHRSQFRRIPTRNPRIRPPHNLLIEPLHIFRLERRFEHGHLIQNTSQRPYIRFGVIGLVVPHFRTGVVRGACLGFTKSFLGDFRDVHVAEFGGTVLIEEYIGALGYPRLYLEITM